MNVSPPRNLQDELSQKAICRFCLTNNDERLQNIFTREKVFGKSNLPSSQLITPALPIQIMAIASIEVLSDDGMPPFICQECFRCFEYCYQFKQMCKKAEHLLRQVPLTGVWPDELQRPKLVKTEAKTELRTSISNGNNDKNGVTKPLLLTYGYSKSDVGSGSSSESMGTSNKPKSTVIVINGRNSTNWSNQRLLVEKREIKPTVTIRAEGNGTSVGKETCIIIKQNQQEKVVVKDIVAPKRILNTSLAAIQQRGNNTIGVKNNIINKTQINNFNSQHTNDVDEATQSFLRKIENDDELSLDDVQRLVELDSDKNTEPINIAINRATSASSTAATTTTSSKTKSVESVSMVPTSATLSDSNITQSTSSITNSNRPKLLNKSSVRILNKEAAKDLEPRLSVPKVKQNEDGNVEIVAEILDVGEPYEHEPDPKDAKPVEVNVFPCPMCERSFPLLQLRDLHIEKHKRKRDHQCEICSKSFYTKYDLQKHIVTHSYDKPFKCTACNKTFARSNLLFRHEKTHTEIPKYICVHCEKPFLTPETLEKHVERHNKHRPYQCKLCNKAFAFKQGLERHEILHSRQQPHRCQYCELSFSTTSKLARHLTAHAGERPFPCKICSKSYLLSHHFTRHLRSHKNVAEVGSILFQCTQCKKQFPTQRELVQHSSEMHAQNSLFCPICNEKSTNISDLKNHINLHSHGEIFACEFCDYMFMSADKLQAHTMANHAADMKVYNDDEAKQRAAQEAANNVVLESINDDENKESNYAKETLTTDEENIVQYFNCLDSDVDKLLEDSVENFYIEETTGELKAEGLFQFKNEENVSNQAQVIDQIIIKPGAKLRTVNANCRRQITKSVLNVENDEKKRGRMDTTDQNIPSKRRHLDGLSENQQQKSTTTSSASVSTSTSSVSNTLANQKDKGFSDNVCSPRKRDPDQILKGLPQSITVRKSVKSSPTVNSSATTSTLTINNSKISLAEKKEEKLSQLTEAKSKTEFNKKANSNVDNVHANVENKIKSAIRSSNVGDFVKMQIGDQKVKLHKILVTKSEAAALAKDGRIQYEGGNMILRGNRLSIKRSETKQCND